MTPMRVGAASQGSKCVSSSVTQGELGKWGLIQIRLGCGAAVRWAICQSAYRVERIGAFQDVSRLYPHPHVAPTYDCVLPSRQVTLRCIAERMLPDGVGETYARRDHSHGGGGAPAYQIVPHLLLGGQQSRSGPAAGGVHSQAKHDAASRLLARGFTSTLKRGLSAASRVLGSSKPQMIKGFNRSCASRTT